jgi:hypothetical protein
MRKFMYGLLTVLLCLCFLVILVGCSAAENKSPGAAFQAFFNAAKQNKYSEATKYISSDYIQALGAQKFCWGWTNFISKIDILKEDVKGEAATLKVQYDTREKKGNIGYIPMIMENGIWKIQNHFPLANKPIQ